MKTIVFTQRVEIVENYNERRDCADQHIADFIYACGFLPVPIPNRPDIVDEFLGAIKPDGLFLSGGNDLVLYGGNAFERDKTETILIKYAEAKGVPLFGICRGMQMISAYYGAKLHIVDGHIGSDHRVSGIINRSRVNSYHGRGVKEVSESLVELARSDDGVIEAVRHKNNKVLAIMWHPERVEGFDKEDIELVSNFYNGGRTI